MSRRLVGAGLALVMVAVGCGRETPQEQALSATERKLEDIRSGRLTMKLLASAGPDEPAVGFSVEGPFAVGTAKGALPVADLRYTRITGARTRTTRFLSTGQKAFVELDGTTYRLADDQTADLRVEGAGGGGLDGLSLGKWLDDPELVRGEQVGGMATDRITGRPDPVPVINDLLRLASQFSPDDQGAPRLLSGDAAERVRRATRASSLEMVTGRRDRFLRRLEVTIELRVDDRLRAALADLAGARLSLSLGVDQLNRPVSVAEPPRSRPAPREGT